MTDGILCAVRGPAETVLVRALGSVDDRVRVTRRCADLAELLGAAAAGLGQVAIVSLDLPGLDREAVHHLHASAVRVIAIADPAGGWTVPRAVLLGFDAVVEAGEVEQQIARTVLDVLDGEPAPASPTPQGTGPAHAASAPVDGERLRPAAASVTGPGGDGPAPGAGRGSLVAVWGPTGAPGRSTIALNLAAELAEPARHAGHGALLVDADTYGGTIAQMLGLLDEAPGIAAAARAASIGRLDARALAALTPVLDGGLRVLTGISRADRWPEVPASSLELVWAAARRLARWTVVDCGFNLEQDEVLSYDTRAPRRNAATLSALAEADLVVVVGSGDPIGLQRLVRALGELAEAAVTVPARVVVVNRVRASASGPRPGEAIRAALLRYAGVATVHLIPDDRVACDGAVLAAATLREHAPASAARRAVAEIADGFAAGRLVPDVVGPTAGGAH